MATKPRVHGCPIDRCACPESARASDLDVRGLIVDLLTRSLDQAEHALIESQAGRLDRAEDHLGIGQIGLAVARRVRLSAETENRP